MASRVSPVAERRCDPTNTVRCSRARVPKKGQLATSALATKEIGATAEKIDDVGPTGVVGDQQHAFATGFLPVTVMWMPNKAGDEAMIEMRKGAGSRHGAASGKATGPASAGR